MYFNIKELILKKIVIATAVTVAFTTASYAAGNTNTGCGLGSQIIKNQDSVLSQVFATTLNGISGNQTFGITIGSLGCDKPAKFVSNEKLEKFVADNMDELAIDIATGQGELLETLSHLLEIENKASFNATLQKNFSKIYTSENVSSADIIDNIITVIN